MDNALVSMFNLVPTLRIANYRHDICSLTTSLLTFGVLRKLRCFIGRSSLVLTSRVMLPNPILRDDFWCQVVNLSSSCHTGILCGFKAIELKGLIPFANLIMIMMLMKNHWALIMVTVMIYLIKSRLRYWQTPFNVLASRATCKTTHHKHSNAPRL